MKILVSAGGTGGHIIPALAVCKKLLAKKIDVSYIGNENSMEYDIVLKFNSQLLKDNDTKGIHFYPINTQKIYRKLTLKHVLFPLKLMISIVKCIIYIKKIAPDVFIGFGGFVAGAPAMAAWLCRCPVHLHEQNCRPGLTNRWTGKFAKSVFLAYDESVKYFKKTTTHITGNPILIDESFVTKQKDETLFLSKKQSKTLFVLGGSQGSLYINNLIIENLEWFYQNNIDLIWQTGKKHLDNITTELTRRKYEFKLMEQASEANAQDKNKRCLTLGSQEIFLFDFTYDINLLYKTSDYIITRGGALSLSEIETYKIPSFIIPLSTAAVNEQYHNALNMQKRNMGMMFEEKEKSLFITKFQEFLKKAPRMYLNTSNSLHYSATENIVDILLTTYSFTEPLKEAT